MKALLVFAALAGTAFVGYSYSATDGKSCLVCPMTGEPVFGSLEDTSEAGCCSGKGMLTGIPAEGASCCSKGEADAMLTSLPETSGVSCSASAGSCCSKGDADVLLTSTDAAECHGSCEKGCCKDKSDAVAVASQNPAVAEEVVSEATETE